MKRVITYAVLLTLPVAGLCQAPVYKGMVNTTAPAIYTNQFYTKTLDHPPLQKGDSVVLISFDELEGWEISMGKLTGYLAEDLITVKESIRDKFSSWGRDRTRGMFMTPEQVQHAKGEEARKDSIFATYRYLVGLTKEQVVARLGKPWEDRIWGDGNEPSTEWAGEQWVYERVRLTFTEGKVTHISLNP